MLEDVAGLFTEAKVRDVLTDSAARASAHIGQVSGMQPQVRSGPLIHDSDMLSIAICALSELPRLGSREGLGVVAD